MSKNLRDSKNDSETSSNTSEPSTSMQVTGNKRKASTMLESPRKKMKSDCKGDGPVAKGTKRKSSTESESPKKRQRSHSNNTDTSNPLPATDTITNAGEAPGTTSSCDPSVSSSSPSSSIQKPYLSSRTPSSSTQDSSSSSRTPSSSTQDSSSSSRTPSSSTQDSSSSSRTPSSSTQDSSSSSRTPSSSTQDSSSSSRTPSSSTQDNRSTSHLDFEGKYLQANQLGEGGFGSVYAGYRKVDSLPVAIKHISKACVMTQPVVIQGEMYMIPTEVLLMLSAAGGPDSAGKSAVVTLLDWYDLDQEVVLVMERPVPSVDLIDYMIYSGPLDENQIKNIIKQLLEAAIAMHSEGVFHRDIKAENLLIETSSDVPRVRIIDFGCGCFVSAEPYLKFSGTRAYAPPEYFMQGSYEAAPTTVWQLGVLLHGLLETGNQFSTSEYLHKNMTWNYSIDDEDLNVTEECQDFLRKCLTIEPEKRAALEELQRHPWLT